MRPEQRHAIRFLLTHLVYGAVGGFVLGALVLVSDIFGLGTMILTSPDRELVLVMLFFGLFVTFGSLGMAAGVMGLGEERD